MVRDVCEIPSELAPCFDNAYSPWPQHRLQAHPITPFQHPTSPLVARKIRFSARCSTWPVRSSISMTARSRARCFSPPPPLWCSTDPARHFHSMQGLRGHCICSVPTAHPRPRFVVAYVPCPRNSAVSCTPVDSVHHHTSAYTLRVRMHVRPMLEAPLRLAVASSLLPFPARAPRLSGMGGSISDIAVQCCALHTKSEIMQPPNRSIPSLRKS